MSHDADLAAHCCGRGWRVQGQQARYATLAEALGVEVRETCELVYARAEIPGAPFTVARIGFAAGGWVLHPPRWNGAPGYPLTVAGVLAARSAVPGLENQSWHLNGHATASEPFWGFGCGPGCPEDGKAPGGAQRRRGTP